MSLKIISLIIALLFGMFGCSSNKTLSESKIYSNPKVTCKNEGVNRYGNDTIFQFSPQNTYLLCSKTIHKDNLNPNILTEFFVTECSTNKILYDDKIPGAIITWNNDIELLIVRQKGIIESPVDSGKSSYTFNVKTHERKEFQDTNENHKIK